MERPVYRYDVLDPNCPSRQVLDLVADKWTVLVIKALANGVNRYGQLQRAIGGISPKMLTQTLRALERNGVVRRDVFPVVPPAVDYSLTELGITLTEPIRVLSAWAEDHFPEIEDARARFDHRGATAARGD